LRGNLFLQFWGLRLWSAVSRSWWLAFASARRKPGTLLAALFVTVWEMFGSAFGSSPSRCELPAERMPALNDPQQHNDNSDDQQDVDEAAERI
jgi:hypothetical protein